jgi:RimJ/RimL family protein N-acetyltransferase
LWLFPYSRQETQTWLEKTLTDKHTLTLGIVERTSGALIGIAGIASMSLINRSGEYFILIGNKESWSKGYGTEVTKLIVEYGFATLNLHRIALTVSEVNSAGVKAYERAGFTREGVLRQACYRDGQYHDKIVMSILRPDWEAR